MSYAHNGRAMLETSPAMARTFEGGSNMGQGICSVGGCAQSVVARGWCGAHYTRWVKHGDVDASRPVALQTRTEAQRFWEKVAVRGPNECWLWAGAVQSSGYGHLKTARGFTLVHRFVYELMVGPIPEGLTIDHVRERGCTSRLCVNVAHLEPVPFAVNLARREIGRDIDGRFIA